MENFSGGGELCLSLQSEKQHPCSEQQKGERRNFAVDIRAIHDEGQAEVCQEQSVDLRVLFPKNASAEKILGDCADDETKSIDALQNVKVVTSNNAENNFVKKSQSQLKGVYGEVGIPVGDSAEIISGKTFGGVVDGTAVGGGTALGEISPQERRAEDPEAAENQQNPGTFFKAQE